MINLSFICSAFIVNVLCISQAKQMKDNNTILHKKFAKTFFLIFKNFSNVLIKFFDL